MATQSLPRLPTELWLRVFQNLNNDHDLPEAWLSLRHVNTTFKVCVETIFRENLLPKTWVRYDLGEVYNEESGRVVLDAEFKFLRVSEDQNTAIFKIDCIDDEHKAIVEGRLREATAGDKIEFPQNTIQIRRDLTDGPVPSLAIDYEIFELSCDWREMFTIFWSEVRLTSNLTRDWVEKQEAWMNTMKAEVTSGQMDMGTMMMQAMNGFARSNKSAARTARRLRYKRMIQRTHPEMTDFTINKDEERRILKELGQKREAAAMMDMSDDEKEDDEEEEDEWDDEDDADDVHSEDGHLTVASSSAV
ncbi:hypothetical protein BJ878DRAFT_7520 [Calycina marina]|uniref:F-box domain-containing protein n=1 Tax=Calycina marina TaxID=1763456 RepID=A0A9P7YUZ9_9HELO|nr:hypothetical protein BJ878DRAFT_7520 [Calycina marina]